MAEINDTGVESPGESSDSVELTPEVRDEQTIARLLGEQPGEADEASTDAEDATDEDADEGGDDEESSDAGEAADDEGETSADDDDLPEVTDEDIDTILDALEDRILSNKRVQGKLDERARAEADRRFEERRKAESVSQEGERLIRQGRTAVENVYGLFDKLNGNLAKAANGDDIEPVTFRRDDLMAELGAFGAAAVAEASRGYDDAFTTAFREGAQVGGEMTDAEKDEVIKIVQTAQRIANDPKQGRDAATAHLFGASTKFLVERARAAGRAEAEAAIGKRRDALKKVTGENGTKAAVAKLANTRRNLPGKPAAKPAGSTVGAVSMEAYREAKAAGDFQKAQQIADAMQSR